MPHIVVDDETLSGLEAAAQAKGLTVAAFLRSLVEGQGNGKLAAFSIADFERELDALATHGPRLPADFSRADIYAEHD